MLSKSQLKSISDKTADWAAAVYSSQGDQDDTDNEGQEIDKLTCEISELKVAGAAWRKFRIRQWHEDIPYLVCGESIDTRAKELQTEFYPEECWLLLSAATDQGVYPVVHANSPCEHGIRTDNLSWAFSQVGANESAGAKAHTIEKESKQGA